jgi:hypothetical protein
MIFCCLGGVTSEFLGLRTGQFDSLVNAGRYAHDVLVPPAHPKKIKNTEILVLKAFLHTYTKLTKTTFGVLHLTRHFTFSIVSTF